MLQFAQMVQLTMMESVLDLVSISLKNVLKMSNSSMVNAIDNAQVRQASLIFFALDFAQWICINVDTHCVSRLTSNAHNMLLTRLSILTS